MKRFVWLRWDVGLICKHFLNGSNTKGYFVWSFLDLFELLDGYTTGYGLYYVDLNDKELTRYPKLSAHWYANFLQGKNKSGVFETKNTKETLSSAY
ncbi:putative glycoside hydrolase family 1, glycoside hydrolase superfamily [Helianthus annuus]|nr:putative glycoside hydrolase family 1, glycoside hydrolase superfamily [Helianthus annuus]KAJ0647175.1 putative glycoside hydrolase family 1, glycoside hydrolase superfamily [Helianthus annuus]KAJ0651082.1 putative glycoside hydrolase family 1, glycoside hydrolase superfamily [Helianthus annuus]KAJ0842922.1 putative glycoside hydrolase family 1, glycoside hydrolase superfamily [Helianthus annuus]